MKIIRKAKPIKIVPFLEKRGKDQFLVIRDEAEVFKWNFSEIRLDQRPKFLLIGDSVVSGYFYRPGLTLAMLLQETMPEYQIIDLTRIELYFYSLPDYSPLVKALRPEKVVLSVGYNFDTEPDDHLYDRIRENYKWILDSVRSEDVKIIIPQLTNLLKKLPRHVWLRPAIRKVCTELNLPYLDLNELFKDDSHLIDYTHYTHRGLKIISEALTGIPSTFKPSERLVIESYLNAFFASYYRSYTELCISLLEKLKDLMEEDFEKLCDGIRGAIFSANAGLFLGHSLKYFYERRESDFVISVSNTNHLYYPSGKLFQYLDQNLRKPLTLEKKNKINLLEIRRRAPGKYKVMNNPKIIRSPGAVPVEGKIQIRFHSNELTGEAVKLRFCIKSQSDVKFELNGIEILNISHSSDILKDEIILNLNQNHYYELTLMGLSAFRVERLILEQV